jgi:FkbM family methyltransferase
MSSTNNFFLRTKFYLQAAGLSGWFRAIQGKLLNSIYLVEMKTDDLKFPLSLRIPSSDIDTYAQVFTNQEFDFNVNTSPKTIIDAGANIGFVSIYFANKYPNAKIIAIEPEVNNFNLLKKNVKPYRTIIPVQAALWSENGEINLVDPGHGNWGFMTEQENSLDVSESEVRHTVKAITVAKIIDDFQLDRIDIFKIDIEGAEKEVFSDTSAWISYVDTLIIELHENLIPGCNQSFFSGAIGFENKWQQGEKIYLSRETR